jgi:hypothetical protein
MRDRYETTRFPMGFMDFSLFYAVIAQLAPGTEIDFHKDGEPLLHRGLPEMIAHAKRAGMFTHVVTNGILLGRQKKELVASGLDLLTVSIVDDIPRDSIAEFMAFKGDRGPFTQVKVYGDRDDLPAADGVIRRPLHNWTNDPERTSRKSCSKLLNYAAVNWDGGYAICCVDWRREMVPFNVTDVPLQNCFEFSRLLYKWQERGLFLPPCRTCNYWQED